MYTHQVSTITVKEDVEIWKPKKQDWGMVCTLATKPYLASVLDNHY